ncbi:carbon starvation protein A [Thermodesulfobium sp. 4217-1]|uniref:carbon starvation CstA family protein n=1 Tax=Thermodesulfobium sp. 4217-1 TaxID=3120013 RepID=UPI003221A5F6
MKATSIFVIILLLIVAVLALLSVLSVPSAVLLLIFGFAIWAIGYRYYSAFLAAKVMCLDSGAETPACKINDGRDFVPTNKYVLFGHQFAAIAGAGPLIGPVLAAQFGFMPGLLWLVIGAALAGAVHDFVVLVASTRRGACSLADIARREISGPTGKVLSLATFLILVLAMAGLSIAVVNALKNSPWGIITVGLTIPIAFIMAFWMYVFRPGKILEASLIGVVLLFVVTWVGGLVPPQSEIGRMLTFDENTVKIILPTYAFIASVLPVWMLLLPRDYLSSYMKIGVAVAIAICVFIVHPNLQMPAFTKFDAGGGPIIPGPLFPYLFITIACGAISGFHALVGSGTTPKMISCESDARFIGYGAMILESFVGVLALIAACVLPQGDYFAINTPPAVFEKLGMIANQVPILSAMVHENLAGRPGGAVSLAAGVAYITEQVPFLSGMMAYWYHFIIMFEAMFILSAIDAGTRVGRYLLQEFFGYFIPQFKDMHWNFGIISTGFLMSFFWGYLLYSGNVSTIWPIFGATNQLLATFALIISTTEILRRTGKFSYAMVTFLPAVFMTIVTFYACWLNFSHIYMPLAMKGNFAMGINAFLSLLLLAMGIWLVLDSIRIWSNLLSGKEAKGTNI